MLAAPTSAVLVQRSGSEADGRNDTLSPTAKAGGVAYRRPSDGRLRRGHIPGALGAGIRGSVVARRTISVRLRVASQSGTGGVAAGTGQPAVRHGNGLVCVLAE